MVVFFTKQVMRCDFYKLVVINFKITYLALGLALLVAPFMRNAQQDDSAEAVAA